ncbi:IucA/IucC family protein [Nonomuraea basaltis]|uniref:IucA/IucC family protein n=1 Tax=Nonomuraea basaltis TaxID=2495887 RepID=UPI00110C49A5|nr:IucA/IucC family siderophore biosynthesis protein [Nonomuraea basaltis]TMR98720.1 IucA/IucC family siderophore biosynthesis protein [Nonomuraea basaltis]
MGRMADAFAAELAAVRPDLSAAYAAALPGAQAAVLGRLWRSLLYEPLPGVAASPGLPCPGPAGAPLDQTERAGAPPVPAAPGPAAPPGPTGRGEAVVLLCDGRRLTGRARLPYDLCGESALWLDDRPWTHPAELLAALRLPGTGRLVEDLDNSVASLALSRANATAARTDISTPEDYEQSVVDGHPYHPCCRNRPGVSVAEQLAYMPEHRPMVTLDLVAVPAADCLVSGAWPAALTDGDRLLLPVHPWQTRHVLPALGLRPYVTGAIPARPLMSVRTLAPLDGGPHLKTAFSTRMTSDVRDISPGSIRDCVALSHLLTELSTRLGGRLRVARYLAGAAAAAKGEHSADLSVMLREPTSAVAGSGTVLPVAGSATVLPVAGSATVLPVAAVTREMIGNPAGWLAAFARLALTDALGLLALGAALEAHGQNLLVVLDGDGRPSRLIYRDLADVRLSPARLARNGVEVPPVSARLLSDDPGVLHAKLFGSLIGTTFGSLISLFCRGERAEESRLWAVVAAAAREAFDGLPRGPDARADRNALFGPHITVKAHLVAQLEGAPPGDSWTRLPNPLTTPI